MDNMRVYETLDEGSTPSPRTKFNAETRNGSLAISRAG